MIFRPNFNVHADIAKKFPTYKFKFMHSLIILQEVL